MEKLNKIIQEYLKLLDKDKQNLLTYLIFLFSEIARSSYIEANNSEAKCIKQLEAFNELIQIISKQVLVKSDVYSEPFAYPDDQLFKILKETFDMGGASQDIFYSVIYDAFRKIFEMSKT